MIVLSNGDILSFLIVSINLLVGDHTRPYQVVSEIVFKT